MQTRQGIYFSNITIMTEKDIREFFPFLCNHRITSQRAVRLDALSRMCIAYNDLICMLACNDYEHRQKITRKIDSLYRVMDGFSINGLVQKYRLTKEVTMAAYGPKDEACSELYYRLVDKYLKRPATADEISVMQCVVYEIGNIAENNTEFDFYPWFRERCGQWISELDGNGCWQGLSDETALRRLRLLQDNSRTFRDTSLDSDIFRAYNYYKAHIVYPGQITAEDLPVLGAWYDLLRIPGIVPYEPALLQQIAGLLADFAATAEPRSDAWYFATSYAVTQCCADLIDQAQREMMQQIA